jgi:hypothetical protein
MFSVENLLKSRDVLASAHMSSADRKETTWKDISSGREKKRWKLVTEDMLR